MDAPAFEVLLRQLEEDIQRDHLAHRGRIDALLRRLDEVPAVQRAEFGAKLNVLAEKVR